ncbi:hypothetical protein EJ05DRAFT_484645 [Pseudovirgaria hyperparasitica]|uniref:Uncharacterized protein n=1 Tax=Pseudovirgaria hyperparasitica TaxID=470096 RepID=A0A6A6WA39_9PEZI|nr:uncharacterized protein EJ05DRAFT_484645 [Pseudovirgaria hyperparasitica]KAF2759728.1 hypothetical protein EJ05DRAFT_484645 [Pseudovirgaria hyperparasitica]
MAHYHRSRRFSDMTNVIPSYPSEHSSRPHLQFQNLPPPPLHHKPNYAPPSFSPPRATAVASMAKRKYTAHERQASYDLIDDLLKQSYDELHIRCDARIILVSNESMKLVAEPIHGTEDIDLDLVDYEALEDIVRDGEYDQPYYYSKGVRLMFRKIEGAHRHKSADPPRERQHTRDRHGPSTEQKKGVKVTASPSPAKQAPAEKTPEEAAEARKRDKVFTYGPGIAVALAGVLGALAAR